MRDGSKHVTPSRKRTTPEEAAQMEGFWLDIEGMACPDCAARVQNHLLSLYGVLAAHVDHRSGCTLVIYNPGLVSPNTLVNAAEAVAETGRGY